jgi:hypothetical protein
MQSSAGRCCQQSDERWQARPAEMFGAELKVPMLAMGELYGSKLVAAMDRQHPSDLFDTLQMFDSEGLTDATVECFVTYLAGHNRPIHEVLFGTEKDISGEYNNNFIGMTAGAISLEALLKTRSRRRSELTSRLSDKHRTFLMGLARGAPDWTLLVCPHAADLPALRWKLANLKTFSQRRPADFERQAGVLEAYLR